MLKVGMIVKVKRPYTFTPGEGIITAIKDGTISVKVLKSYNNHPFGSYPWGFFKDEVEPLHKNEQERLNYLFLNKEEG